MRTASWLLGVSIVAGAGGAQAQTSATSTTDGSASISAPVAIGVTQNLSFTLSQAMSSGLTITSSALRGATSANILLTSPQTSSLSVPATFDVVRVGGSETITVRTVGTAANFSGAGAVTGVVADGGLFSQPVTVVGNIDSGQLSFNIAGAVTVGDGLTPGQYSGVIKVVAQFN
jgi:hypothetical protein